MRLTLLPLILVTQPALSCLCNNEVAFHTGAKAIESKHPEYEITRAKYEAKELEDKWVVLRKESVYKNKPQEYPRAFISQEGCKLETVLWSK